MMLFYVGQTVIIITKHKENTCKDSKRHYLYTYIKIPKETNPFGLTSELFIVTIFQSVTILVEKN